MSRVRCLVAVFLFQLTSCGSPPRERPTPSLRPNYNEDVYPIFAANCFGCHANGSVSSRIQLETFAGARASAVHLSHAVGNREMPPWGLDNTGNCGTWADPRWLAESEIDTILEWIDDG